MAHMALEAIMAILTWLIAMGPLAHWLWAIAMAIGIAYAIGQVPVAGITIAAIAGIGHRPMPRHTALAMAKGHRLSLCQVFMA